MVGANSCARCICEKVEHNGHKTTGFLANESGIILEGKTGIAPLGIVIQRLLKTAYTHHIEPLMVLGNFMLLCEFDPDEVYRWFIELNINAYDWVMVPNVYRMSQHAAPRFKGFASGTMQQAAAP